MCSVKEFEIVGKCCYGVAISTCLRCEHCQSAAVIIRHKFHGLTNILVVYYSAFRPPTSRRSLSAEAFRRIGTVVSQKQMQPIRYLTLQNSSTILQYTPIKTQNSIIPIQSCSMLGGSSAVERRCRDARGSEDA